MRKLASIQKIAELYPIEGADLIEVARVNDWKLVVKKGEFKVGDYCAYFEIDSLLPMTPAFEFLASRGTSKSELEDGSIVEGYRLKTIKLRKQVSQGLALPWKTFYENLLGWNDIYEGLDVTELLGVHKYEKPMPAQLAGMARGNFPSFIRKTDQERCQNIRREIWEAYTADARFEVTYKLDGSSMTAFVIDDVLAESLGTEPRFGVCSRNLELKETEGNAFWSVARSEDLEAKIRLFIAFTRSQGANEFPNRDWSGLVIQGELLAPNIQSNFEGVTKPEFHVYSMFDIENQYHLSPLVARMIAEQYGLRYVPVLHKHTTLRDLFPDATIDTIIPLLLEYAEGDSGLNGKYREGIVFKRTDGLFSFKAISNRYLLKEKD